MQFHQYCAAIIHDFFSAAAPARVFVLILNRQGTINIMKNVYKWNQNANMIFTFLCVSIFAEYTSSWVLFFLFPMHIPIWILFQF